MKKAILVLLALCMVIYGFPVTAKADDSEVVGGTSGTVYPVYNTEVEMEEEIIDITVKDNCSYVNCQFNFHNTGKATKMTVGFPAGYPSADASIDDETESEDDEYEGELNSEYATELNSFSTFINSKSIPITIKEGLKAEGNNKGNLYYPKWYTWEMTMAAGAKATVINKYWTVNTHGTGLDWEKIDYILRSGSTWKGPIGKVTVRMKFEGYYVTGIDFDGMRPTFIQDDETIIWKAENIEPKEDVIVDYDISFYHEGLDNPLDIYDIRFDEYIRISDDMLMKFEAENYIGAIWKGIELLIKFRGKQPDELYQIMGQSCYMLGNYQVALAFFSRVKKSQDEFDDANRIYYLCLYCKAAIYGKTGDKINYKNCLQALSKSSYPWLQLWAKSRLDDMGKSVAR